MKKIEHNFVFTFVLLLMILFKCGCDKRITPEEISRWNAKEIIKEATIGYCEDVLKDEKMSDNSKSLATLALKKWKNGKLDSEPILIFAMIARSPKTEKIALSLGISDEDSDIAGIGIREIHKEKGDTKKIIEEEYPVFGYGQLISSYNIIYAKTRNNSELKNESDWKNYLLNKNWKKEAQPDLYVSIPDNNNGIYVDVWVYDHLGNKSNMIQLENRLTSK